MTKNISKRRIVVDGADYRWGVSRGGTFVVWQADGRRTLGRSPDWMVAGLSEDPRQDGRAAWHDWDGGSGVAVTPFDAANWIRGNLMGTRHVGRPAPVRPRIADARALVAVAGPQPEAYVVVSEAGDHEDYCMAVIEVHLDPQVARDSAKARNEAQAIRRALCRELYDPIFAEYDRLRALGAGDAEVAAAGHRLKEAFFRKHGLRTQEERDFIGKCPADGALPRHSVLPTRLLASALVRVAA